MFTVKCFIPFVFLAALKLLESKAQRVTSKRTSATANTASGQTLDRENTSCCAAPHGAHVDLTIQPGTHRRLPRRRDQGRDATTVFLAVKQTAAQP